MTPLQIVDSNPPPNPGIDKGILMLYGLGFILMLTLPGNWKVLGLAPIGVTLLPQKYFSF